MWLILADDIDTSAYWLYQQLQRDSRLDIRMASALTVASNIRWNCYKPHQDPGSAFIFADGQSVQTSAIRGVLNRLSRIPSLRDPGAIFIPGCETDPEQTAYFINWIYSLSVPVVNRPDILNLTGVWRRASDWTVMAAVAGLQPAPFRSPTPPAYHTEVPLAADSRIDGLTRTVFVVGGRVVGTDVPAAAAEGCVRLSHILNCDLIAVHFSVSRTGAWLITGFSPQPDLRLGGSALVDVISGMMLASTTAAAVSA